LQNVLLTAAAVQYFYGSSNYNYRGRVTTRNKAWLLVAADER